MLQIPNKRDLLALPINRYYKESHGGSNSDCGFVLFVLPLKIPGKTKYTSA